MSDKTDIVERLREGTAIPCGVDNVYFGPPAIQEEAADEIERLRAENERLRGLVARIESGLNKAFSAGVEEREGGSIRRQAKALEEVESLRGDARAALAPDAKP